MGLWCCGYFCLCVRCRFSVVTGDKRCVGIYPNNLFISYKIRNTVLFCWPLVLIFWCNKKIFNDRMMLNVFFHLFLFWWLCCSKQRWAAHPQDEAELPGSGAVLQRCAGIVGEKTDSPRQNDCPARQGGDLSCTLPRWETCVCTFLSERKGLSLILLTAVYV